MAVAVVSPETPEAMIRSRQMASQLIGEMRHSAMQELVRNIQASPGSGRRSSGGGEPDPW